MKTKDWVLVIAALILSVLADQASKIWALNSPEIWIGPMHLILIKNYGAMLGFFSDLPAFLRVVALSTSGFFIFSLYAFIQFMMPQKILLFRVGLSLLVGGILGNVLDRTFFGYVVDFVGFQFGQFHTPVWNLADMIQWLGYLLIVFSFLKDRRLFWPDQELRSQFWINRNFQLRYASVFVTCGIFVCLICMAFSYSFFKISVEELGLTDNQSLNYYKKVFLYSFLILILACSFFLFAIAKFISHRIAGPIYAFERFLENQIDLPLEISEKVELHLRSNDEFKNLEVLALKIKKRLHNKN